MQTDAPSGFRLRSARDDPRLILDWQRVWIDVTLVLVAVPAYLAWRRFSRA